MSIEPSFNHFDKLSHTRLSKLVDENTDVKTDNSSKGYSDTNAVDFNLLRMKQINDEMQRLAKQMRTLCETSEEAIRSGKTDDDYQLDKAYYQHQTNQTKKAISDIPTSTQNPGFQIVFQAHV